MYWIVIVVVLVLVFGLLTVWLMRRTQKDLPEYTDARDARKPQVVGSDQQGRQILDADEPEAESRDQGAFENLLQDEIKDRGMTQPVADDEV